MNIGKKGAGGGTLLLVAFIMVIAVLLFLYAPTILSAIGLYSTAYSGPQTQGVVVSSVSSPSSVSPSTNFAVTLYVSNNVNGQDANNIELCLDNLGFFSVASSPNEVSGPSPCTKIPNLLTGGTFPETYSLSAPSSGAYANIPYSQDLGYYIEYSYGSSAAQTLEFVSQNAFNSNDYPAVQTSSFHNTAGPVNITTIAVPVIYGNDVQLQLGLIADPNGFVSGPVHINVSMPSNDFNLTNARTLGFDLVRSYPNGTVVYNTSVFLGSSGANLVLPISLSPQELQTLSSSSIPYLTGNIEISTSYTYEQNGFVPISLNIVQYYTP